VINLLGQRRQAARAEYLLVGRAYAMADPFAPSRLGVFALKATRVAPR
jgi:hypothetical protein